VKASWLALSMLVLGCSAARPKPYEEAAHAAERAYSAGRYQEAAESWLEAAAHGEPRDRQEAEYRAAASYERGKQYDQALAIYTRLAAQKGERAARALLAAAEIERRRGSEERAQSLFLAALRNHPDSGPGEIALREHVAFVKESGGVQAALSALEPLIAELDGSELDERLRYERARLLDEAGNTTQARDAYLDVARRHPYPEGALWDDALFRAALCEEKLGRPQQAIQVLEGMLLEREEAHLSGSYERARYAEARFKIAELYRDALGEPARARAEFRRVWNEHPTSLLRDDALFEEALIARAQNDQAGACRALELLLDAAPDSRFVPCAPRLCPSLKATDGRRCRDYLLRRLERD